MGDGLLAVLHAAFPSLPITPKVLLRPPFPFLHAVCVAALGDIGVFAAAQLDIARLSTRELKAGFLTRALALVTFALQDTKPAGDYVSVLFLVSPVQVSAAVLAGLEVDRTHEFLHQLAVVVRLPREALAAAAERVVAKGERGLYTMAVTFRRGLVQGQAAVRRYLVRKSRRPAVGTTFLKEFEGFGIFEGVVQSVSGRVYVVAYPADGDEEELDLDELLAVLKRSRELQALAPTEAPPAADATDGPVDPANVGGTAIGEPEAPPKPEPAAVVPADNNVFKALEAELHSRKSLRAEDNQEPAWRTKLLSLLQQDDDVAAPFPRLKPVEPPLEPKVLDEATLLALPPPSLPRLEVPGGLAQWSRRMKQSKAVARPVMPALVKRPSPRSNQKPSPPKASGGVRHKPLLHSLGDPHEATFDDYATTAGKSKLIYKVIQRIDRHLRRKHLRVVDLFRYCDSDGSGGISRAELEDVLKQLDIQLPPPELDAIMTHLDKNGNGVIDMDEFESLVRMNRRTDARRDQLRREFPHVVHSSLEASHQMLLDNWAANLKKLLPYRDAILGAARAIDKSDTGSISVVALRHILRSIEMPKVRQEMLDDLFVLVRPVHNLVLLSALEAVFQNKPRRENKFLDHTWLAQFDAQMDKVRDLGL
ncbi:hypothetical protein ACHHYP_05852 [Achlya hypogyna]|uniref:EF-hand domain-containing protein n=1 Tax=Achlya hypogyna TaxID=1202772 RepID=A0A1V9YWI1_ACHHY|nr:hypothetical protein ACHHYP_05852 [Achlya hypogyna]